MDFVVIIPARYQSSRLPGKPLADIAGQSMIQRVHRQAVKSKAKRVIVATDDARIAAEVESFSGEVCMTSADHNSGTERLAEVIDKLGLADDQIIVNVQGDEPFIPEQNIVQVANNLAGKPGASMATLSVEIDSLEEVFNPNAVKVVADTNGYALYFSRSTIPYDRQRFLDKDPSEVVDFAPVYQRHIGIYAYRADFIKHYLSLPASQLEQIESLEQLRVLWHGFKIHVETAGVPPPAGIDTPEDLAAAVAKLQRQ